MTMRYDYNRISLLVNQSKAGDSSAFAELYTLTYNHVYNYALHYLRDSYMAQDAVQEIFIIALRNLKQLSDPQLFIAWLNQINFRTCYRMHQKDDKTAKATDLTVISRMIETKCDSIPESHAIRQDVLESLNHAIDTLPPVERQAVYLRFFRNMKLDEIAVTLDISRSTVKRHLANAKELLKDYLKNTGQEGVTLSEFE